MSEFNSVPKRTTRTLFPYAVLPEKQPFFTKKRWILLLVSLVVLGSIVVGAAIPFLA